MNARSAGFTLLEVLIALAIFAVFAVSFLQVGNEHLRTAVYLEDRLTAIWLAESKLNEARALGSDGVRQGNRSEFFAGREWSIATRLTRGEKFGGTKIDIEVMLESSVASEKVRVELGGYL